MKLDTCLKRSHSSYNVGAYIQTLSVAPQCDQRAFPEGLTSLPSGSFGAEHLRGLASFLLSVLLLATLSCHQTPRERAMSAAQPASTPTPPFKAAGSNNPSEAPSPDNSTGLGAVAISETGLFEELEEAVRSWVEALNRENEAAFLAFVLTEEELKPFIPAGQLEILRVHLLPKNDHVLRTLLNSAAKQTVEVLQWSPGQLSATGFDKQKGRPTHSVSASRLAISLGGLEVRTELRLFRFEDGWKALQVSVSY